MKKKILLTVLFTLFVSLNAFAGEVVWGPKKYVRGTGKPVLVTEKFTIDKPKGKFWLRVESGEGIPKSEEKPWVVEPVNQVSSAIIFLNGVEVVSPNDFNQEVYGFIKRISHFKQITL